jgi:hypothetical protein
VRQNLSDVSLFCKTSMSVIWPLPSFFLL